MDEEGIEPQMDGKYADGIGGATLPRILNSGFPLLSALLFS